MLDIVAMGAALAASDNPSKILSDLDDDDLADIVEDSESDKARALAQAELARRKSAPRGAIFSGGTIIWLIIIVLLVGSIALLAFR
ncbi:MAG: hypothetical protein AAGJ70_02230 [Pseudomonadota bacterium]